MPKNPFGVLILHGITGTPENVRNVAPPLEALGLLCSLPTLRGHGAETAEALRHVTWQEWMEDAENALFELLNETEKVIVIGHSMGGWIALNLAVDHKDKIDSLIVAGASTKVVSPLAPGRPLHFLFPLMLKLFKKWKLLTPYTDPELAQFDPAYGWAPTEVFVPMFDLLALTEKRLAEVTSPILIMHSKKDSMNSPEGAKILYDRISTPPEHKHLVWFEKTEHAMFQDCEREEVIRTVVEYVKGRMKHEEVVL